ncbi:MAG: ATP-binding cassette domain-containing protein, partial [Candidatus Binataceae bacterium]
MSPTDAIANELSAADSDSPAMVAVALSKRYGARLALDRFDLTLEHGEIVGLLGPNGAGKTTTLSILSGVIRPDAGSVSVAGHDLDTDGLAARRNLGLAPQSL